ncbi:winged helix-turn-helix domain-containing protein [Kribbella sp. NBC_01245]|uniref:winged helix-turn-helix domain-containing protein n=1 Tax=Kribbella sp. NBC_01245 TaxID=2903578 RepID=UPI002E29F577|nr:winged helix-turn-helix domain-containing protein [Kribbella sp. NBC_01245]
MRDPAATSLVIGVASTPAERVRLAGLLAGADAFLLVSTPEQARAFLDLTGVQAPEPAATKTELAVVRPPLSVVVSPELQLDIERRILRWRDREVGLTRLEHDFLHCLVAEPGEVWTYQRLHSAVWGNEHLGHGSHIHSVVKRLRRKLARVGANTTIHAIRGVGFHLLPV